MTVSGASPSIPVMLYTALLVTCLCLCHVTCGYRVLLVPLPDTGQCRQMVSIGRELKARGHQVVLFVPEYFRARRCTDGLHSQSAEVEIRTFDTSSEEEGEQIGARLERLGGEEVVKGGSGLMGDSGPARELVKDICYSYMESRDDLDQLKREGRFHVVLVDGSPQARCLTLLPAYLGAPFVAVSSYIDPYDSSLPLPTSFYPAPTSGLPGNLGFLQRLANFLGYARYGSEGWLLWGAFQQSNALGERVSRLDHGKLAKKALLYLENSDYIIDYPKALFPNFVQVGGLTAGPSRPLPGPLARFFDESGSTGVVVMSLGPQLFTPTGSLEAKLLSAFRRLDSRVLVRLNASRSMSKFKHVQTVSWFPQNDALGHASTRLFVSHCGKNSFFEALYHGVPLLCVYFGDSDVLGTAARVAEYGVGLSLDLLTASSDALENAITSLLTERAYSRRMKAASKLFHTRPHTPAERAASAIEDVLKYGGGYLRPRSVDMSFFQYAGLDIALVLCTVVFGLVGMVVVVVVTYVKPALPSKKASPHHQHQQQQSGASDSTAADSPVKATTSANFPPEHEAHSSIIMYFFFVLLILFYVFM